MAELRSDMKDALCKAAIYHDWADLMKATGRSKSTLRGWNAIPSGPPVRVVPDKARAIALGGSLNTT